METDIPPFSHFSYRCVSFAFFRIGLSLSLPLHIRGIQTGIPSIPYLLPSVGESRGLAGKRKEVPQNNGKMSLCDSIAPTTMPKSFLFRPDEDGVAGQSFQVAFVPIRQGALFPIRHPTAPFPARRTIAQEKRPLRPVFQQDSFKGGERVGTVLVVQDDPGILPVALAAKHVADLVAQLVVRHNLGVHMLVVDLSGRRLRRGFGLWFQRTRRLWLQRTRRLRLQRTRRRFRDGFRSAWRLRGGGQRTDVGKRGDAFENGGEDGQGCFLSLSVCLFYRWWRGWYPSMLLPSNDTPRTPATQKTATRIICHLGMIPTE